MGKRLADNCLSPGSRIPWGKRAHLQKKKKWKFAVAAYLRDVAIGSQEVSRASVPVQPLGFLSLETCNLQLPSPSSPILSQGWGSRQMLVAEQVLEPQALWPLLPLRGTSSPGAPSAWLLSAKEMPGLRPGWHPPADYVQP